MNNRIKSVSVVFICSSLDPGRDGVGDYSRRLTAAMIKQGHCCAIVSLNDRGLTGNFIGVQEADGIGVPVIRIASINTDKERYAAARKFIKEFNPDWISLQFVPFGFHARGLKFGLSKLLLSVNTTAKWHVMVHELWVGMDIQATIKHKAWGRLQNALIASLIKNLKPAVITTQSVLYLSHLTNMGYEATYLPLFSNIPKGGAITKPFVTHAKTVRLAIFGNIHHGAPVKDFCKEVAGYGNEHGIVFSLKLLGNCGNFKKEWIQEWESSGLKIKTLGEQPAELISSELLNADIGITTTPVSLTDKSGSFAAMRGHHLPVISVSRHWQSTGFKNILLPDGVFYYQKGNFKEFYSRLDNYPETAVEVDIISGQLSHLLLGF